MKPAATEVIALWPDGPPTVIEGLPPEIEFPVDFGVAKGGTMLRNISEPTLSIFEPTGASNGQGIIVAPGGGWTINAWTHEGLDVVDWLAPLGYTVFLLKYRVQASHPDQAKFDKFWAAQDSSGLGFIPKMKKPQSIGGVFATDAVAAARLAAADDGRRAIEVVRDRFAGTVGMLGFSAGAFLAVDIALDPRAEQLAYIAPIYGGETRGAPVPADAPPLFTAVAQDDILVRIVEGLYADWTAADRPAELHAFARGAHGFGMVKQGMPSDQWTDLFLAWMEDCVRG